MSRLLCLLGRHHWGSRSMDFGRYRTRTCDRCHLTQQQQMVWADPVGPWRVDVRVPCTHAVGGGALPGGSCMNCATARSNRGLR